MKLHKIVFFTLIFLVSTFAKETNKKEDILSIHPLTMLLINNSDTISLTKKEKEFLKKYPEIIIGSVPKWLPYVYETNDKKVVGFNVDIVNRINMLTGANFKFELDEYKNIIKKVKENKIDGITSFISEENSKYFNFSIPFLIQPINIIVKHGNPLKIKSIKDLENKTIVIQNENYFLENIVKEIFPNSKIIYKDSYEDVFEKVVFGEADATINETHINFLKNEKGLPYLNRAFSLDKKAEMGFSIRRDMPEAISILNKGIEAISTNEIEVLYAKWFGNFHFNILKENHRKEVNNEIIVQVILVLIGMIFLVLLWNIQLKKSVNKAVQKNKEQENILYYYSAQDAMKDFVGNISHQWKQPINELSSVLFYLETKLYLKQEITNEDIQENTLKSRAIIDYLSKTVSVFSNYYVDNKTEIDINILTLFEQSIFITNGSFSKLNTKINLDIKNKDLKVKGEFLKQVILVILNNARNIIIERNIDASFINIKLYKKDAYSILEIEDNFGGINNIDTIFNIGTTNSKNGTGLGLFISKRIIEDKYQGKISVRNGKKGAIFTIKLPIN